MWDRVTFHTSCGSYLLQLTFRLNNILLCGLQAAQPLICDLSASLWDHLPVITHFKMGLRCCCGSYRSVGRCNIVPVTGPALVSMPILELPYASLPWSWPAALFSIRGGAFFMFDAVLSLLSQTRISPSSTQQWSQQDKPREHVLQILENTTVCLSWLVSILRAAKWCEIKADVFALNLKQRR